MDFLKKSTKQSQDLSCQYDHNPINLSYQLVIKAGDRIHLSQNLLKENEAITEKINRSDFF